MNTIAIITIILSTFVIEEIMAQTFQYSRGWTNGKRSDPELPPLLAKSLKKLRIYDNVDNK